MARESNARSRNGGHYKFPIRNRGCKTGGRLGVHTSHLGFILAEMQSLPRTYPAASW